MPRKPALTIEEKKYIEESLEKERSVEHICAFLNKDEKTVADFAKKLKPELFEEPKKTTPKKSPLQQMMSPREGISMMTPAASQVGDDIRSRQVTGNTNKAIHKPLG